MKFKHSFKLCRSSDDERLYVCNGNAVNISLIDNSIINVKVYKDDSLQGMPRESNNDSFGFGDITVNIESENMIISYLQNREVLFSDRAPLAYNFENEFGKGVFHYLTREKGEKIYGLGDKAGYLNKAGNAYKIETTDSMGYDAEKSDPLYKHVPFYICENSVGSYGIYYVTSSSAYIDLGREHNNYYAPYKYFRCEDDEALEYYVFFGTKLEILQQFGRLIGKCAFPPKWSFDYCASTMSYTDAQNAEEEFNDFLFLLKKYDISCRGFYLSSGYTSIGDQRCVFNWNREKFPHPDEFIKKFRENKIEIIPNIKPAFLVTHPMYRELAAKGMFIKNPDGTPFVTQFWDNLGSYLDFYNPETKRFWKEQVKEKLLDYGITTTWNDNNEFDIKDSEAVNCHGDKACRLKPQLTFKMVEASFEAQMEEYPFLRPFLSTRSGNINVRTLAQTWSGDNYTSFNDLKFCHFIGLTMSLSGFYFYGHDLGGFAGELPEKELFLRWLQHGVFEPRFTIHSWNDDKSSTMPWSYPDLIPTVREIFAQRKMLIPYIYNCAYNAVENEIPLNAPLFLYYDDKEIDENGNTFMLGSDIMAMTVFDKGKSSVKAYLPAKDDWYLDGVLYDGGQEIEVDIPAEGVAKYFVKAGSVIPCDVAEYGFMSGEEIMLHVYPLKEGDFKTTLFFDDGGSIDYLDNYCTLLDIEVHCSIDEVSVKIENKGNYYTDFDIELCNGDNRRLKLL
ncbi:MAG: hypothetical protein IJT65_02300 [Eubacterium sp.]|nr:hypothetical protein [Eubacterium sp.]